MIKALLALAQGKLGTGYIHAPLPESVKPLHTLIGSSSVLPVSASVYDARVKAKFQSSTDACLGFAAAQAWRLSALKRGIDCPDLSGLVPYKLGRASIGLGDQDAGMTYGAMTAAVERFGLASEESYPFNVLKVNFNITGGALRDAYDRRGVRGIYAVDKDDADGVRRALSKGIALVGAWQVNRAFMADRGSVLIDAPDPEDVVGNHAMVVEGYNADGSFDILNHYDISWRQGGRCQFTERYMKQSLGYVAFDLGVAV